MSDARNNDHEYDNGDDEPEYSPWLVVHDGLLWFISGDIWVVPGASAAGVPSPPTAGSSNWVWARVWNDGKAPIYNATVNFYWADPTTAVTRATAKLIGTAYVNVPAQSYITVSCPNTWTPAAGSAAHLCLVVEAFDPIIDPLLSPTGNSFNVIADRHVAQRNVIVVAADASEGTSVDFEVVNPDLEQSQLLTIGVDAMDDHTLSGLSQSLGWPAGQGRSLAATHAEVFRRVDDPEAGEVFEEPCSELSLGPGERSAMTVRITPTADDRGKRAVAVVQRMGEEEHGGLVVVVTNERAAVNGNDEAHDKAREMGALELALAQRPALARELVTDPSRVMERLGVTEAALRCPDIVHEAYERGQKAAEAALVTEDFGPVERMPAIAEIATEHLGADHGVTRIPYGLRFVEQIPEGQNDMAYTGTATFECVFGPGCHADVDG